MSGLPVSAVSAGAWQQVGIGLRQPHYAEWPAARPPVGFVEVHSENFYADGGAALALLDGVREHHAVSLHGVGLGLGSAAGIDPWHLDRLARLVQRIEPVRVSDHACFARAPLVGGGPVVHANDLLPLTFTEAALRTMAANVGQVQDRLGRPMLVENLSSYLSFDADDAMSEPAFFARLCREAGCAMLLDVNNLMVNALNAGAADPVAACRTFVDALPLGCVGEIHVAGYAEPGGPGGLVIDDHGSRVRPAVWQVCAHAIGRFGAVPTLIEWDTDVPPLAVMLAEADAAVAHIAAAAARRATVTADMR